MKLLVQISNVLKRLCPEWMIYNGTPPELISTLLDKSASVEDTAHALYKCLRQTYETVKMFVANNYDDTLSKVSFEHNSKKKMSHSVSLFPHSKDDTSLPDQANAIDQHLPEMELIEALIESPYTQTIESYYDLFLDVPQSVVDNDKVWPIPCDCVPYAIFSSIYDNVTELTGRQVDSKQKSQEELSEETDKDHSAR
ncbi:unnamed protein product [Acanthoscelides obtectus]|uniref:Uncharacterized protein n=1 Tax=Acanthoscelides obtectus TaxID=200917 RepID=A0A9P0PGQ0_ACAOB|nr:unnamed protein product [Acanthoscelides obtectus]CAK1662999.1 hypothetical protein AOBTE_LOCUS23420 [Acanthoscelides obtectus]